MKMKTLSVLIILLTASIADVKAEIYKCTSNGKTQYKPKLEEGCEKVDLKDSLSSPEEIERQRLEREKRAQMERDQAAKQESQYDKKAIDRLTRLTEQQLRIQQQQLRMQKEKEIPIYFPPIDDPKEYPTPKGFKRFTMPKEKP